MVTLLEYNGYNIIDNLTQLAAIEHLQILTCIISTYINVNEKNPTPPFKLDHYII